MISKTPSWKHPFNRNVSLKILNTISKNAKYKMRQSSGEAAIRGMNTAVLWSPFFVSFAVGQLYLPSQSAWLGIIFGLLVALLLSLIHI